MAGGFEYAFIAFPGADKGALELWEGPKGGKYTYSYIQGDQLNLAVFFWYLVKNDLSSLHVCSKYTGQVPFYKVPEKTRPCLTGNPVIAKIV